MKIAIIISFHLILSSLIAQKDGLRPSKWSIEAGMILNKSFSHYSTEKYNSDGTGLQASPSSLAPPVKLGALLGASYQINNSDKFLVVVNLSLTYSQGQYKEEGLFVKIQNGPHGSSSTEYLPFENEITVQSFFVNYGVGLKIKLFKQLFMQNNMSLFISPYTETNTTYSDVITNWVITIPKTKTYFGSQLGVSYQVGLFYRLKIKPALFDVGVYRHFSLTKFVLPLWVLSVRYNFN